MRTKPLQQRNQPTTLTMDHYDCLGVRQNASSDEIELAYRSRRSQYHPDKYSTSDAETQRWATIKMQEVNAAHALLSNQAARAAYDAEPHGKEQADTHGARAKTHGGNSARANVDTDASSGTDTSLQALLAKRFSSSTSFSRTYLAPRIPAKKLMAALGSYGHGLAPGDVLVLIDTTVFGGAKEGVLIAEREVRAKELASDPVDVQWANIKEIEARGMAIWINGRKFTDCTMLDKPELTQMVSVFREHVAQRRRKQAAGHAEVNGSSAHSDEPWENPTLRRVLFDLAKERVVSLSELLADTEEEIDQQLLNRSGIAHFFSVAEEALEDPEEAYTAYQHLLRVAEICNAACECLAGSNEPFDPALWRILINDLEIVRELRMLLAGLMEVREEAKKSQAVKNFFNR